MVFSNTFQSSNSQIIGKNPCFNMFQYVFPMFQSYSQLIGVFPHSFCWLCLRSSTADSSFASPGPYNHGTTSWPPVRKPSGFSKNSMGRLRIHGFFMVSDRGKMMNPKKMGVSIHFYDVPPKNMDGLFLGKSY